MILAHLVPLKKFFKKKLKLNFFGYEIPKWKGINIDNQDDWDGLKNFL